VPLPPFDGSPEWYERYGAATADDGVDGRLVSCHTFTEPWPTWEVHPVGEELVVCVAGEIELIQELADGPVRTSLRAGEWCMNPAGVWHTADVPAGGRATCIFVTAGMGTENRDR